MLIIIIEITILLRLIPIKNPTKELQNKHHFSNIWNFNHNILQEFTWEKNLVYKTIKDDNNMNF